MLLSTAIIATLALIKTTYGVPTYGDTDYNKRCNHWIATATTIDDIQCGKNWEHDECNNICRAWADRLKAISLHHDETPPGDPWGSSHIKADFSHSSCNGDTGLDPTATPCTCVVRLWRGRSYEMPISQIFGDPDWNFPNLRWDKEFTLADKEKVRCGGG